MRTLSMANPSRSAATSITTSRIWRVKPAAFEIQTALRCYRSRTSSRSLSNQSHRQSPKQKFHGIPDVESLEKYCPGGYHPISIGAQYDRYRIVQKLGYGGFSTVWLAYDTSTASNRYVALKVGIADSRLGEIDTMRELAAGITGDSRQPTILTPLHDFTLIGPNGSHSCYTTSVARGSLRQSASFSPVFPIQVARALCYRLASTVAYIHERGYVHGDIRMGNILEQMPSSLDDLSVDELYKTYGEPETIPITCCDGDDLPPNAPPEAAVPMSLFKFADEFTLADTQIVLQDFGESFQPAKQQRRASDCRTPQPGIPPEAFHDPESIMSFPADIWSLATTLWDIIGMQTIFYHTPDNDLIFAQQINMFGAPPEPWWENWSERHRFFDEDRKPQGSTDPQVSLEEVFQITVQRFRQKWPKSGVFGEDETWAILQLTRNMLRFRPSDRITAANVLESSWMTKWCLPNYESSVLTT